MDKLKVFGVQRKRRKYQVNFFGGTLISHNIWFIDTNILAHWVLGRGNLLRFLCDKFDLHDDFFNVYEERYRISITFIETILNKRADGIEDEFYVSSLATNELFSAIRDEIRSIIFFKQGTPISRWRDARNVPHIPEACIEDIYRLTLQSFDTLFENRGIVIIPEVSPWDTDNYWSIFASLLFLIRETRTQDATLLTTAILNKADYFVTLDKTLITSSKEKMRDNYRLLMMNPTEGIQVLNVLKQF